MRGGDVSGPAVRIGALAGAGEVLVSGTVRDLVVGSGLEFRRARRTRATRHRRPLAAPRGAPGTRHARLVLRLAPPAIIGCWPAGEAQGTLDRDEGGPMRRRRSRIVGFAVLALSAMPLGKGARALAADGAAGGNGVTAADNSPDA